jgi:hypothetical protein
VRHSARCSFGCWVRSRWRSRAFRSRSADRGRAPCSPRSCWSRTPSSPPTASSRRCGRGTRRTIRPTPCTRPSRGCAPSWARRATRWSPARPATCCASTPRRSTPAALPRSTGPFASCAPRIRPARPSCSTPRSRGGEARRTASSPTGSRSPRPPAWRSYGPRRWRTGPSCCSTPGSPPLRSPPRATLSPANRCASGRSSCSCGPCTLTAAPARPSACTASTATSSPTSWGSTPRPGSASWKPESCATTSASPGDRRRPCRRPLPTCRGEPDPCSAATASWTCCSVACRSGS